MTVTTQKVWLVTGASLGFGAEIAKGVIAAGGKLIATARKIETLAYLGTDDNVFPVALDVTDEASAKTATAAALQRFGRIDVLVNNAGYVFLAPWKRQVPPRWRPSIAPTSSVCSTSRAPCCLPCAASSPAAF